MRKRVLAGVLVVIMVLVFGAVAFVLLTNGPENPVPLHYAFDIVNVYPHDAGAFTQGLVFEDGFLYEGTGLYGQSSLRRVELETGEVLQVYNLGREFFGEGVTVFGDRVIQLTWRSNKGFVYDKYSFDLLQEFSYPTEGWGITHDGGRLIMSDGSATLYFLDPVTFEGVGQVEVRDPQSGQVVKWIDLTGLRDLQSPGADVLNGIAYDAVGDRLFVTGKRWSQLYEIKLTPSQ